jgi:hypothetical protein
MRHHCLRAVAGGLALSRGSRRPGPFRQLGTALVHSVDLALDAGRLSLFGSPARPSPWTTVSGLTLPEWSGTTAPVMTRSWGARVARDWPSLRGAACRHRSRFVTTEAGRARFGEQIGVGQLDLVAGTLRLAMPAGWPAGIASSIPVEGSGGSDSPGLSECWPDGRSGGPRRCAPCRRSPRAVTGRGPWLAPPALPRAGTDRGEIGPGQASSAGGRRLLRRVPAQGCRLAGW